MKSSSLMVALLAISVLLSAQAPDCSEPQAIAADNGIDRLKTWAGSTLGVQTVSGL
jgi:hypothetical protein